jgi:hypothetical protein
MAKSERIDFISSYCDRWCDRCAFTERCSSFACDVAIGMCGDVAAGIELAVGIPEPVEGTRPETAGERMLASYVEPSAEELAAIGREEQARHDRLERHSLARMSKKYGMDASIWLDGHRETFAGQSDPVIREALDIVGWDALFIGAKVRRAIDGRDRHKHDEEDDDDDPVQNDWNGSAKVGIISMERSEAAWRVVAAATRAGGASVLADAAAQLHRAVLDEFPHALSFIRPGFDEPWTR